jgi:hypothetical protein
MSTHPSTAGYIASEILLARLGFGVGHPASGNDPAGLDLINSTALQDSGYQPMLDALAERGKLFGDSDFIQLDRICANGDLKKCQLILGVLSGADRGAQGRSQMGLTGKVLSAEVSLIQGAKP